MKYLLPMLAMACTAVATVTALVFCMAMGANSTPEQFRTLKLWMAGLSGLGLAGVGVGFMLIRSGQMGWASIAALAPTVIYGVLLGLSLLK